jgi:hypothetical protein
MPTGLCEKLIEEKFVAARRGDQHAGRVRYPGRQAATL